MGHMLKGLLALAVAVATVVAAPVAGRAAGDPLAKVVFQVQGMTCGGCEAPLELAVKKLPGVEAVKASYPDGRAEVTYRPSRVGVRQIQAAIERLSYRATVLEPAGARPAGPDAKPAAPPVASGLRNLAGLKDLAEIFRQTRGQPRLVLLLSPT